MSSRLKFMAAVVGALVALSRGVVAAAPRPAPAAEPARAAPADGLGEITARTAPDMFEALQRDLDLTRDEALARIEREGAAHVRHADLTDTLGDAYAGAWLDEDAATLTVAVSDPEMVTAVRAAGARPQLVAHPLEQLEDAQARLRAARAPTEGVAGWFVDHEGNRLVVQHRPGRRQAARDLVAAAGVDPQLVRFEVDGRAEVPTPPPTGEKPTSAERSPTATAGSSATATSSTKGVTSPPWPSGSPRSNESARLSLPSSAKPYPAANSHATSSTR
jgi:streptogrisin C